MSAFRTILVATDFSESSQEAFDVERRPESAARGGLPRDGRAASPGANRDDRPRDRPK